jgi:hypothetical protein
MYAKSYVQTGCATVVLFCFEYTFCLAQGWAVLGADGEVICSSSSFISADLQSTPGAFILDLGNVSLDPKSVSAHATIFVSFLERYGYV